MPASVPAASEVHTILPFWNTSLELQYLDTVRVHPGNSFKLLIRTTDCLKLLFVIRDLPRFQDEGLCSRRVRVFDCLRKRIIGFSGCP